MTTVLITLTVLLILLVVGNWALEHVCADSAMRLAIRLENESKRMRRKGEPRHTFAFCPKAHPRDPRGEYRIELHGPDHYGNDEPALCVADSGDDPPASTVYHRHFVNVPRDLRASHHRGEPTLITLEERDGEICVTDLR